VRRQYDSVEFLTQAVGRGLVAGRITGSLQSTFVTGGATGS
jgi:hypothetical protein